MGSKLCRNALIQSCVSRSISAAVMHNALLYFIVLATVSLIDSSVASSASLIPCYRESTSEALSALVKYKYKCDQLGFTKIPDTNVPERNRTVKLSLRRNRISSVDNEAFLGMGLLEEIDLDDNVIQLIQSEAFFTVQRLKILSLGNNLLQSVPKQAWERVPELSDLDLSRNQLQQILNDDFRFLVQLKRLELSWNNISTVEPFAFKTLHELKFLSLAGNRIVLLDTAMDKWLPYSLQSFQVQDNPWHCDCRLRWLFNRTMKDTVSYKPSCSSPEQVRRKSWSEMHAFEFACTPSVQRVADQNGTQEASRGSSVTLACYFNSDPINWNVWYRNGDRIFATDFRLSTSMRKAANQNGAFRNYSYVSELKISQAVENDSAVYTCEVVNSAGINSSNISLVIVSSRAESGTVLQKSQVRFREATALHYALIVCSSIASIVTLISVIACAFYCTKRLLLLRYSSRCRAYRPTKLEAEVNVNLATNGKSNGRHIAMSSQPNAVLSSASDDLSTYRSCNFVDSYNCLDSHLNMLNSPQAQSEALGSTDYCNIGGPNDAAAYLPNKGTVVILQADGSACHHLVGSSVDVQEANDEPCELNVCRPRIDTLCHARNTDVHNFGFDGRNSNTLGSCITFKPAVTPAQSNTSSFSTLTLLRSSRRHQTNGSALLYAPIACYEDDQLTGYHKRTASTTTFTHSSAPRAPLNSDRASLV